jgi:hypothetical protein
MRYQSWAGAALVCAIVAYHTAFALDVPAGVPVSFSCNDSLTLNSTKYTLKLQFGYAILDFGVTGTLTGVKQGKTPKDKKKIVWGISGFLDSGDNKFGAEITASAKQESPPPKKNKDPRLNPRFHVSGSPKNERWSSFQITIKPLHFVCKRIDTEDSPPVQGPVTPTAAPTAAPTVAPTAAPAPLTLISINAPSILYSYDPPVSISIYWSGDAVWPVRVYTESVICPPGTDCYGGNSTFSEPANPIVAKDALWCRASDGKVFGWRTRLTDSSLPPQETDWIAWQYTCKAKPPG